MWDPSSPTRIEPKLPAFEARGLITGPLEKLPKYRFILVALHAQKTCSHVH